MNSTGVIENYRSDLVTMSDERLDQTEEGLKRQLTEISSDFGGKLKIIDGYEKNIYRPISGESFEVMPGNAGKKEGKTRQETTLEERMRHFEEVLTTEAARLEQLHRQWFETQLDLISLALEILGSEGLQQEQEGESIEAKTTAKFHAAIKTGTDRAAEQARIEERAKDVENSVKSMGAKAGKELNDNEKVRLRNKPLTSFSRANMYYFSRRGDLKKGRRWKGSNRSS